MNRLRAGRTVEQEDEERAQEKILNIFRERPKRPTILGDKGKVKVFSVAAPKKERVSKFKRKQSVLVPQMS